MIFKNVISNNYTMTDEGTISKGDYLDALENGSSKIKFDSGAFEFEVIASSWLDGGHGLVVEDEKERLHIISIGFLNRNKIEELSELPEINFTKE